MEDNAINVQFAATFLKKNGFTVVIAENGEECLNAVAAESFDVVLMDIQMPVMNGEDALKEIRSRERGTSHHLPVIAVTAYAMRGEKNRFLQIGFDGYVSKPLVVEDLMKEVHRVISINKGKVEC